MRMLNKIHNPYRSPSISVLQILTADPKSNDEKRCLGLAFSTVKDKLMCPFLQEEQKQQVLASSGLKPITKVVE